MRVLASDRRAKTKYASALAVAFALTAAIQAVAMFGGASLAYADNSGDINCTGTVGGGSVLTTIKGNVTVPQGASCTLAFVNVSGNVQVQNGGSLLISGYLEPSMIGGNVQANNCFSTLLEGNVTVQGNLQISNCSGPAANGFRGPGIVIGGNFKCQNNAGSCEAWLGQISGDAQIQKNRGSPSDVSLNAIGGNLQCRNNAVATTHKHGYNWVTKNVQGECGAGFSTTTTSIGVPTSGGMACAELASLPASGFPVPNTVITSAKDTAARGGLPERCIVTVSYNPTYISPISGCHYHDDMQVQMPVTTWNGRFFYETANVGALRNATTGVSDGYAAATDDAGVLPADMAACGDTNQRQYFADPYGEISNGRQTQQITALTAKYLIAVYYGKNAAYSYAGGCSGPGRHAMMLSQTFPQYFDGIYAGAPGVNFQRTQLSQIWNIEQVLKVYLTANPPPVPPIPATVPNTQPNEAPERILYQAFSPSDRTLFERALLQACDALDGVADGVIDNPTQCQVAFDPATASYVDSGNVTHPLQCPGNKDATCLSPAQIRAMRAMQQGPRTAGGRLVSAPSGGMGQHPADRTVLGYPYDGGWGGSTGMLPRFAGTSMTSPPAVYQPDMSFFFYGSLRPPVPSFDPTSFDFDRDMGLLAPTMTWSTYAGSLDLSKFAKLGHKIIFYHGDSDSQHNVGHTVSYYDGMAQLFGGVDKIQNFSRMYVIPNMAHCGGGPATDQFDVLGPLAGWVEKGISPGPLPATGANFTAAQYAGMTSLGANSQPIGGPGGAPTTRSRPLCPYPQQARFTGSTTIVNGVPVATTPSDLGVAANYKCVLPPR